MKEKKGNGCPKVSIIVPCFNQGAYISETLDSVLSQSFTDFECIVVDDGSTDNSKDIAQEYCKKDIRIKYLRQKNAGVSAARNNGVAHSSGRFILPLDADDLIAPSYIEKAVSEFEKNPKLKLVYCNAKKFGAVKEDWRLEPYDYNKLLWTENLIFVSGVYKRKDFKKTSGYNVKMKLGMEDWDFYLSLLRPNDKVCCLDEFLFFYRIKNESRSVTATKTENKKIIYRQIYENHLELYKPFMQDLVYLHNLANKCEIVENSESYKIGHFLVELFSPLKRLLNK